MGRGTSPRQGVRLGGYAMPSECRHAAHRQPWAALTK